MCINLIIKTARHYGTSGRECPESIKRLAEKAGSYLLKREKSLKKGNPFIIFSAGAIEKNQCFSQSCKKLQTDYLDTVLLHSNGKDEEKILEGLDCLKKTERRKLD